MKKITDRQEAAITQAKPLVSIIVPVYQVKEYIGECVESLLRQTYTNLEILLVDDGSTDGSGELCDVYAAKDARVRVVHQENRGLSAARNTGIDLMKGEYASFVDSDDVVLPDFIETLYELARKYRADVAACAYVRCTTEELMRIRNELSYTGSGEYAGSDTDDGMQDRQAKEQRAGKELCVASEQLLRRWHGKYKKWETVAWNKLYRADVLRGRWDKSAVRFPIGRRHEDVLTSHLLIANADRVVMTRKKLYLYRVRPGSITDRRTIVKYREENLRAQRERMAFFREKRYWRAYWNLWVGYALHWGWFWGRRLFDLKKP